MWRTSAVAAIGWRRPLLSAITSGDAVIALWRYTRAQPPPLAITGGGS